MVDKDKTMPHYRTPMAVRTELLQEEGFTEEFQISDKGLKALNSGKIYQPQDLKIREHFRYEGITNPDDEAVMYVVETKDGLKGIIVNAFGIYANTELSDFMKEVEDLTVKNM
ncbi:MAG TPA: hypothetical protein VNW99_13595 [Cytophagaceae bacterium]|jgi:hypothetical protein|nr:hypothetical protein [Cytophagaceae bacterium]